MTDPTDTRTPDLLATLRDEREQYAAEADALRDALLDCLEDLSRLPDADDYVRSITKARAALAKVQS